MNKYPYTVGCEADVESIRCYSTIEDARVSAIALSVIYHGTAVIAYHHLGSLVTEFYQNGVAAPRTAKLNRAPRNRGFFVGNMENHICNYVIETYPPECECGKQDPDYLCSCKHVDTLLLVSPPRCSKCRKVFIVGRDSAC